jgi:DNA-binding MarR family transcriptional regulator
MSRRLRNRQDAVNTGAYSRAGGAVSELVERVFRLDGRLRAVGDALAEPSGQTTARWRVLAAVDAEPLPVAQIAREWSLARQSVQRIADELERDGLISYAPNPRHRRAQLVQLTTAGEVALSEVRSAQRSWANRIGRQVDARAIESAVATLDAMLATVGGDAAQPPIAPRQRCPTTALRR